MAVDEKETGFVKEIRKQAGDFPGWYNDVVRKAQLADNSPVAGTMIVRPYGYALWENIRDPLDRLIKQTGHENWYFPALIPLSFLQKEKDHVAGFAPEFQLVTQGGGKDLEEPLVLRPTSETMIATVLREYIQSYRDLPVLTNQWNNIFRWELRTRFFLRTREFLWQEGHTFHETAAEAEEEVAKMLDCYRRIAEEWCAIPVLTGRKSESEKFAGAQYSTAIEQVRADLEDIRVKVDWRDERPGFKFNEWELKGVPLRIEIGPRDLAKGEATVVRRLNRAKQTIPLGELGVAIPALLEEVQGALFRRAREFREAHTVRVDSLDALVRFFETSIGFAVTAWCGREDDERTVKDRTTATTRVNLSSGRPEQPCAVCGRPATMEVAWGKAY